MKAIVKYMSLLLFCGLILLFLNMPERLFTTGLEGNALKQIKNNKPSQFTELLRAHSTCCHKDSNTSEDLNGVLVFSFIKDVSGNLFPVLKNLN
jgi:hypothetical protein